MDLQTKHVFVSRDVRFFEDIIPFREIITPSLSQLFPTATNFINCDPLYSATNDSATSSQTVISVTDITSSSNDRITPSVPQVSDRPHRARQLPSKFSDHTGLHVHLCHNIQFQNLSTDSSSSLTSYVS